MYNISFFFFLTRSCKYPYVPPKKPPQLHLFSGISIISYIPFQMEFSVGIVTSHFILVVATLIHKIQGSHIMPHSKESHILFHSWSSHILYCISIRVATSRLTLVGPWVPAPAPADSMWRRPLWPTSCCSWQQLVGTLSCSLSPVGTNIYDNGF